MKIRHSTSLIALAAVLGTTGFAIAGTSANTFAASVSVLSPDQSGFIIGGQVAVNGVGTGALTLTRSVANMNLTGAASSTLGYDSTINKGLVGAISDAQVNSSLDFDRSIKTSGAMVGLGSVVARGEAIAALGSAGAASADTGTSGTGGTDAAQTSGTSSASAAAQGSLNGSLSTSNTLQLLGTSGLFAGSNGLDVGETNNADAYGAARVVGDGTSGVTLNTATLGTNPTAQASGTANTGYGALFNVKSTLKNSADASNIALSVSNAGNGSISITTSTGGFFTGGGAASGEGSRNQTGSFFSAYGVNQP